MSEQAARRDVVVAEHGRYGPLDIVVGPLYAGVEMAHAAQR
jgi:hypothetical protein